MIPSLLHFFENLHTPFVYTEMFVEYFIAGESPQKSSCVFGNLLLLGKLIVAIKMELIVVVVGITTE